MAEPRSGASSSPGSLRTVLVALCVTEIVSYGVIFYAFTVLLPEIIEETGWTRTAVTAAFSAGSIIGGTVGILAGRILQERGPWPVMTAGSLLGTVAVSGLAWSPSYAVFFGSWALAGAATAGLFYPPAFAALTGWYGERSVRAITVLTLAAGFSSTIFAPLTAALAAELSWRQTYLVLGLVLLLITFPIHLVVLRRPWPHDRRRAGVGRPSVPVVRDRDVLRSRTFVLATTAGTLMAFSSYAGLVYLVPLLTGRGMSTAWAAWALGLGGAGQVAGRVLYPWMTRRLHAHTRAAIVIATMAVALLGLAAVPGPTALVVLLAVLAGASRGLFTLVGATLVSDYWGRERYAALSGVYQAPVLAASALSPLLGALVADLVGGYVGLYVVLAVTAAVAAALAASVPAAERSAAGSRHQLVE